MKKLITICSVVGLMVFATSTVYALPSDNFDDDTMGEMWTYYQDDPCHSWLEETSGRLEFHAITDANDAAALYVANGWGFLTTSDFSFKVDFHYSSTVSSSVVLGLAKDEENDSWLEAGYEGSAYFCWDAIVDDETFGDEGEMPRDSNDGTLYISYDASEDELYVSGTGYWSDNAWGTFSGLVQGAWGADMVGPLLGGCSGDPQDATLPAGEAYLDNFVVSSGVPEPATIALLGLGSLLLSRKRGFSKK